MALSTFWIRFKKNKLSIAGSIVIILLLLVAMLGYLITPDRSPNANQQFLSLAAKPPLFKAKFLLIQKNQAPYDKDFFHTMIWGKEPEYIAVPIDSFHFEKDQIIAFVYTGAKSEVFEEKYNIANVAYALNPGDKPSFDDYGFIHFIDFDKKANRLTAFQIQKKIVDNLIVEKTFLLGTDKFGRDLLSRILIGARVSLAVGFISVIISILIGISLGIMAGYYRGKTDSVIMWLVNVVWSVPTLLMVLSISLVLGKGFWQVFIAVGLTMWVEVTRVVRGQVISIREKEYVEAAKALGFNDFRILFKHILPNVMGPVIIISAANFASAILMEAGLSFLGIGVQPPVPSWGSMIKDHYGYIILNQAHLAIIPGMAIMIVVLAFNFIGNGLRDGFDTRMD